MNLYVAGVLEKRRDQTAMKNGNARASRQSRSECFMRNKDSAGVIKCKRNSGGQE